MQKTTPPKTLDTIIVSAKLQKYGYVNDIPTSIKLQISLKSDADQGNKKLVRKKKRDFYAGVELLGKYIFS